MGWIFYKPASVATEKFAGKNVPATYDIDWTADSVPCQAPGNAVAAR